MDVETREWQNWEEPLTIIIYCLILLIKISLWISSKNGDRERHKKQWFGRDFNVHLRHKIESILRSLFWNIIFYSFQFYDRDLKLIHFDCDRLTLFYLMTNRLNYYFRSITVEEIPAQFKIRQQSIIAGLCQSEIDVMHIKIIIVTSFSGFFSSSSDHNNSIKLKTNIP